jgi:hypothetical protein
MPIDLPPPQDMYYTPKGHTPVQVVHVDPKQIYGKKAVRMQYPGGDWVVYLSHGAGPLELIWELHSIDEERQDDYIPGRGK